MAAAPDGVNSHTNVLQLSKIVILKTARNDGFFVLWRNCCCAISAPGQPPANDSRCRVLSGVRLVFFLAAVLSAAYMLKVSRLTTP